MQQRAVALAAEVTQLQRDLVSKGSALQWLHSAGVFPGPIVVRTIRSVMRLRGWNPRPVAWTIGIRGHASFAIPSGGNALAAAFEALKRDANTPLPVD